MDNQIIKKDYIFLDVDLNTQAKAFDFIAQKAFDLGIVSKKTALIQGLKKREAEGSTGFEDGFAIPHARIQEVIHPAVFVVRFKNGVDWQSMDGQPTKIAIALLVPEGPNGDQHLSMLSDVAVKLMNEEFKAGMKKAKSTTAVVKLLNNQPAPEKNAVETKSTPKKLNILAITACAVGIAHTYMAEEKLLQAGKALGNNIRVETHGSKGIGTPFSQAEIDAADLVIFATDVNVDQDRFVGKKFYHVPVAKAVKDSVEVINQAMKKGEVLVGSTGDVEFNTNKSKQKASQKTGVLQHILAGISYMIPVIVLGGIALAFSLGLAKAIWGPEAGTQGPIGADGLPTSPWGPLAVLEMIGGAAFTLMIPILGGFIANSIAGRAAIAPAMLGAFIGNDAGKFMPLPGMDLVQTPTGFVGAIIAGLLVGYFVRWVNTWKVPRSLAPAMPIFFIPLIAGIGISLIFIYVIGGPIGYVMDLVSNGIEKAYQGNIGIGVGLALGALLGAMAGFDMGGPINKIAFITASALITQGIQQPMGAVAAAIPVAPLGMGLTTLLFKRFFSQEQRNLGIAALIMGFIGISEGAIPFAISDPRRAIPANVAGSLVAGAIAGAFGVTDAAAHGGPIVAILGAVPYGLMTLYFFVAVIAGVAVTTGVYGFWLVFEAGKVGSVREAHVNYLSELRAQKTASLETLNEEISTLKSTKPEDYKTQIETLKADKKQVHVNFKEALTKEKDLLKKYIKLESQQIKEKITLMREEKRQIRVEQQEHLATLGTTQKVTLKDRKASKVLVTERINDVERQYRQPVVSEYQSQLSA